MGVTRAQTASVRRCIDVVLCHTRGDTTVATTDRTRATVCHWHAFISTHITEQPL